MRLYLGEGTYSKGGPTHQYWREFLPRENGRILNPGTIEVTARREKSLSRLKDRDGVYQVAAMTPENLIYTDRESQPVGSFSGSFRSGLTIFDDKGVTAFALDFGKRDTFTLSRNDEALGSGHALSLLRKQRFFSNLEVKGKRYQGKALFESSDAELSLKDPLFLACFLLLLQHPIYLPSLVVEA